MRTWAEINLDALKFNIENIRKITDKNAKIMAVVKADAYGHGFFEAAEIFAENGADCFAVATVTEAVQLRESGFRQDILILGAIDDRDIDEAVSHDITLAVFDESFAREISDAAKKLKKTAKIHIKLDTGMSRIGFVAGAGHDDDIIAEIIRISHLDNIYTEGIFSHFSTADEADGEYTKLQFNRFMSICTGLEKRGLKIPVRHIANSAAIMMYPETHLDMVRPGIILYGYYPSDEVDRARLEIRPAMTLKSKITHIKTLEPGRGISYGREYITEDYRTVATVPVGYADGYVRAYAKEGKMLIGEEPVKIVGRICMDQCMIDVTNVNNINVGDEVTIFTDKLLTAEDVAKWSGSISYEVLCLISKRVPRIYKRNGNVVKELDFSESGRSVRN